MKNIYKLSFLFMCAMLSLGIFWACKRTVSNDEIVGNQVMTAPSDFTGIVGGSLTVKVGNSATNTVANFNPASFPKFGALDFIFFDNTLSHKVTWYANFKGLISGAKKTITGTSLSIDSNVLKWDGSADGTRFFIQGEQVAFELSFLGSSIKYTTTLGIRDISAGPISYNNMKRKLPNGDVLTCYLVDGMEIGTGLRTSYIDQNDGTGKTSFYVIDTKQVDGYFSFYMKGTDNNGNNYNGGSGGDLIELQTKVSTDDPAKLYFNAYIYGYGRDNNSVFFQVFENDHATLVGNTYIFPPRAKPENDMWFSIVEVDWVGWKLVSVPYSSFVPARDPANGANGNHIKEPRKIAGMALEFDSYPSTGKTVELAVDVVTMTHNGPFQP